jgi:hypothetical protein
MSREVVGTCVGWRTRQRRVVLGTGLALAFVVGLAREAALDAGQYTSDAITQIRVLIGPAPVFRPLHGWAEMPQPSAPPGFVKLPVACNTGSHAPRIWLCYKRGPIQERPLVDLQVASEGTLDRGPFEKIAEPLNRGASGQPLYFYCKRASEKDELAITDMVLRTKFETVPGYECDGQNLNERGRGSPLYLYYELKHPSLIQRPPFAQGISPEMLNAPDTEYEISRAQIDNDHILVRLQKLEVKHATVAARMPFRRTEVIRIGMSKQEMNQVARSLNVGLNGDYTGLKSCVGLTLGWTSSATYTASEETTLTGEVNLPPEEHDRYYAFATVLDVLRISEIATGKVNSEAVSRTDNIGYFVTDRYGSWRSAPLASSKPGH